MAGVVIEQSLRGLEQLAQQMNQLASADQSDLMEIMGGVVESQTRRRLAEEKEAPDGTAWEDLSESWSAKKSENSSGGLMEYQGHLIDSIAYEVSGGEVSIGTNLIYGAIHQFGGEAVGMPTPARPYLGLSADNEQELNAVVNDWINGLLQQ